MTDQFPDPFFETSDTHFAALLIINRVRYLDSHLALDRTRVIFHFAPDTRIPDLTNDFVMNAVVPVQDYSRALRFLGGEIRRLRRATDSTRGEVR